MENLGITLVVLGCAAIVVAVWLLASWLWALVAFAPLAITAGALLIRTDALTPEPSKPEGGEVK
jgi:membrane protein implicated in regulation of membrane protease activity